MRCGLELYFRFPEKGLLENSYVFWPAQIDICENDF